MQTISPINSETNWEKVAEEAAEDFPDGVAAPVICYVTYLIGSGAGPLGNHPTFTQRPEAKDPPIHTMGPPAVPHEAGAVYDDPGLINDLRLNETEADLERLLDTIPVENVERAKQSYPPKKRFVYGVPMSQANKDLWTTYICERLKADKRRQPRTIGELDESKFKVCKRDQNVRVHVDGKLSLLIVRDAIKNADVVQYLQKVALDNGRERRTVRVTLRIGHIMHRKLTTCREMILGKSLLSDTHVGHETSTLIRTFRALHGLEV